MIIEHSENKIKCKYIKIILENYKHDNIIFKYKGNITGQICMDSFNYQKFSYKTDSCSNIVFLFIYKNELYTGISIQFDSFEINIIGDDIIFKDCYQVIF